MEVEGCKSYYACLSKCVLMDVCFEVFFYDSCTFSLTQCTHLFYILRNLWEFIKEFTKLKETDIS